MVNVPIRLTSTTLRYTSIGCGVLSRPTVLIAGANPAQLTNMRATPCAASAAANPASTLASSDTFTLTKRPPIESAWALPTSSLRSKIETFAPRRSEEHTSELQSLMRISYAVFCLKTKNHHNKETH